MNRDINKLANRLHQALEGLDDKKTKLPAKWLTRQEIANHFQVSKDAVDAYAKKHGLKSRVEKIHYECTGLIKTKLHYLPDFAQWKPLRYSNSIYWKRDATKYKLVSSNRPGTGLEAYDLKKKK